MGKLPRMLFADFSPRDFTHANFTGAAALDIIDASRIEKDHEFALPQIIRNFRSELMHSQNFDARVGKFAVERISGPPCDPIIAAERIAITDDKNPRHVATEV